MRTEPERELIRRVAPYGPPAVAIAFLAGLLLGDLNAAWSAAIGVLIVAANFVANGYAMAWASRVSLTAVFAVGMGGFIVRLGIILAIMFALNTLSWFSPLAFALAVIPATIVLLIFELKLLAGPAGQQWNLPEESATS
ncbi:MAG: hypothetical protein WD004_04490 [Actinomycetota bacterium]